MMSFGLTQNWQQGGKPAIDLASFVRSAKSIFSTRFSTLELRACLVQNDIAKEQP